MLGRNGPSTSTGRSAPLPARADAPDGAAAALTVPLQTPPPIESLSDLVAHQAAQQASTTHQTSRTSIASSSLRKAFWVGQGPPTERTAAEHVATDTGSDLADDETIRAPHVRRRTASWGIWRRGLDSVRPLAGLFGYSKLGTSNPDPAPKSAAAATQGSRSSASGLANGGQGSEGAWSGAVDEAYATPGTRRLSTRTLATLTAAVAGAQMAWCLELAFGTPYLLSLGLSKSSTSLVWLAGPMSGLIAQPLVGAMSDRSTSRFRRRKYMLASALFLTLSTLLVAFSRPLAELLIDLTGAGLGDWDPNREERVVAYNQAFAIVGFWILDLSLNALQAASRALILDVAPAKQQSSANAWQGRMTALGNLLGYTAGWLDLSSSRALRWIGGGQFRKLALVALVGMLCGVGTTCSLIDESKGLHSTLESSSMTTTLRHGHASQPHSSLWTDLKLSVIDVWQAARRLPRPVRRVCMVQLFAFMGWFPLLFYSSSYIAEVHAAERGAQTDLVSQTKSAWSVLSGAEGDKTAERGSKALLLYSLIALVSGSLLPYVALASDSRLQNLWSRARADETNESTALLSEEGEGTQVSASPKYKTRLQRMSRGVREGITLRTIWTFASLLLACLMSLTFLPLKTTGATVLISIVGVPWAVASWVPFALVMEQVHEAEQGSSPFEFEGDYHGAQRTAQRRRASMLAATSFAEHSDLEHTFDGAPRVRTQVGAALNDCEPLRPSGAASSRTATPSGTFLARGGEIIDRLPVSSARHAHTSAPSQGGSGGTILGIHNLAIVLPQFVVAIIASLIFKAVDRQDPTLVLFAAHFPLDPALYFATVAQEREAHPAEGVAWVLRFGGLMALCAAVLTRYVPLTKTERARRGEAEDDVSSSSHFDDEVVEEGEEFEED